MSDTVTVAIIGFIGSIIVALITLWGVKIQSRKAQQEHDNRFNNFQADMRTDVKAELQVFSKVTENEIKHLTDEVRKHNNFAEKIPVLQNEIKNIKTDLEEVKHKLDKT